MKITYIGKNLELGSIIITIIFQTLYPVVFGSSCRLTKGLGLPGYEAPGNKYKELQGSERKNNQVSRASKDKTVRYLGLQHPKINLIY